MQQWGRRVAGGIGAMAIVGVGVGAVAVAGDRDRQFREELSGYQEVPALSTPGGGRFTASIARGEQSIRWELSFGGLESNATQAHIHFENATNNGPVVAFLCSNLGNGPAGTPACPAQGGTVRGTITADQVVAGAVNQGLAAGELDELIAALRAGATYVNVHSELRPGGEVRAQIDGHDHH